MLSGRRPPGERGRGAPARTPGPRCCACLSRGTSPDRIYALLAFAYLLVPIAIVILFSFNNPAGRFNYTWQGFTLDNWKNWDGVPGMRSALVLSLELAALSAICATALGTLIALALVRYGFRGRGATNLLDLPADVVARDRARRVAPHALPDHERIFSLGFWTIFIAHVMFCISYVVVTVKARLIGFDRHLEEAAMDLGANESTTFRKVTLPLIAPAILAGDTALLRALGRRLRDHQLRAGSEVTFPLFVWGRPASARRRR